MRDDIAGGMLTLAYEGGGSRLTQWRTSDVARAHRARPAERRRRGHRGRISVGPVDPRARRRGTFTLIGADSSLHRESFDVGTGVLLWKDDGMTFLLQGAGSSAEATSLAAEVGR